MDNNFFENNLTKVLLFESLAEKRKSRLFNFFSKIVIFFVFFLFLLFFFRSFNFYPKNTDHIAVIEINGVISDKGSSSSKNIISSLNSAFKNDFAKFIVLKINSPGGTPVQSNIIHLHIKKLRSYKKKPIYAVIEDIGTSGAYLIAVAAERIYCDQFSIVGSIGVLVSSFGFVDTLNKLGIERRLYKAGKNKAMLDPFLERNIDDEKFLQHNLDIIHESFIDIVKKNRNINKIFDTNDEIFSGKFWIGSEALDLGLVDGFYNLYSLSYDLIKINSLVYYNEESSIKKIFDRRF